MSSSTSTATSRARLARPYQFYPLTPCRLVTRAAPDGDLGGRAWRRKRSAAFPAAGEHHLPFQQVSIPGLLAELHRDTQSFEAAVGISVGLARGGYATGGLDSQHPTATVVANAAIVPAGTDGRHRRLTLSTHRSINRYHGYFAARDGRLVALSGCRRVACWTRARTTGSPSWGEKTVNWSAAPVLRPAARGLRLQRDGRPPGSMP